MKKLLTLVIILPALIFAQAVKPKNTINFSGVVADSSTNEKLAGVTIAVFEGGRPKAAKGATTNLKGEFKIPDINTGRQRIQISYIGYKTKIIDTTLADDSRALALNNIRLQPATTVLNTVEIKGQRPMIEYQPDKQVINVDQIPGANGSVTDALKNTGVVDIDPSNNKISLRGKSDVKILVDGKPLPMAEDMLSQMPAAAIDQIEVSTTPSVKDDPEGDAGIINFITKKGLSDNYSGSFTLFSNNKNMTYGAAFINFKKGAWNVYGSANTGVGEFKSDVDMDRANYKSISMRNQISRGSGSRKGFMSNAKFGFDYDFDPDNSLAMNFSFFKMKGKGFNNSTNDFYTAANAFNYQYYVDNSGHLDNNTYSLTATYKKKFDKKGQELSADIFLSDMNYDMPNEITTTYSGQPSNPVRQNAKSYTTNKTLIAKVDYANPAGEWGKIEAGYNFTFRDRTSDYDFEDFNYSSYSWIDNLTYSNNFRYKENIHALYANYGSKLFFLDYRIGARLEQIYSTGTQQNSNTSFDLNYSSFFPSLLVSYKLSDKFQLTFNTARRIRRPQMEYINPFKRINAPNDYSIGNPKLDPTYINLYELGINPFIKVYHTYSTGRPVSITAAINDSVMQTSMVNNASTRTYGVELMLPLINDQRSPIPLPDWLSMANLTYTWSRTKEESSYLVEAYNVQRDAWNAGANVVLKVWWDINAIVSLRYNAAMEDSRSKTNARTTLNFTISKEFMDKKLRVALTASDILNASMYKTETYANTYYSNNKFTNLNSQNISIAIMYNFNDFKSRQERNVDDGRDKTENGIF